MGKTKNNNVFMLWRSLLSLALFSGCTTREGSRIIGQVVAVDDDLRWMFVEAVDHRFVDMEGYRYSVVVDGDAPFVAVLALTDRR